MKYLSTPYPSELRMTIDLETHRNVDQRQDKAHAQTQEKHAHAGARHAHAWRTHARNLYAQTKGFADIGFVDVVARGSLQAPGQCRCMDMGNSGVAALCNGAFAMEACRTPVV